MKFLPPLPPVEGLHPLVIHLPIGLLLGVPVLLLASWVIRKHARGLSLAVLLVMATGTAGTFAAMATGEKAAAPIENQSGLHDAIEDHEEMAEMTRNAFLGLTGLFAVSMLIPALRQGKPAFLFGALFLALYLGGGVLLANTAHRGGRLVHELGVRAPMGATR